MQLLHILLSELSVYGCVSVIIFNKLTVLIKLYVNAV